MYEPSYAQIGCLVLLIMLLGAAIMGLLLLLPMPLKLLATGIIIGIMIGLVASVK